MRNKSTLLFIVVAVALILGITAATAQTTVIDGFSVAYAGRVYNSANDQTTFTYTVSGTGVTPALSHFTIELPLCSPSLDLVAFSPTEAYSFGTDPTTGITGIKWELELDANGRRTYSLTFQGEVAEGIVQVAVKAGKDPEVGELPGPACWVASIDVEKLVSVDGGDTWDDADAAPGPSVDPGSDVWFRFVVTNDGTVPLTDISLTDTSFDLSGCELPDPPLMPEASFECETSHQAVEGQHTNTALATGVYEGETYDDTDDANYFGGEPTPTEPPPIVIGEGGACPLSQGFWKNHPYEWPVDSLVLGNETYDQAELLTLFFTPPAGDASLILVHQLIAAKLNVANGADPAPIADTIAEVDALLAEFDGPLPYGVAPSSDDGQAMVDAAEVLDQYNNGNLTPDCEDADALVIIEGPIVSIDGNIIVINGIRIWIDLDDALLGEMVVDLELHVEGYYEERDGVLVLIAVVVIYADSEVTLPGDFDWAPFLDEDGDWNCQNPPPDWAPAHGWRAKCEEGVHPGDRDK